MSQPSSQVHTPAGLPPEIFKAYDIRGIVGSTLTPAIVESIGRAIGAEARARGEHAVVVARDGRLSGPELIVALGRGLNRAGCDVIDIGRVPTPVLYFATHTLATRSGVMLTGSHNPPEYNGLKIVIAGETLSGDAIQGLRQRILADNLGAGSGKISRDDPRAAYLARILSDVRLARPLRIAVDCGNGVTGELAPQLFRQLGCEVSELYCEIDGHFPNHHPDPADPKNLRDLIETVTRERLDVGLAFDGDGDRLGVIAPDGTIIWPDRQMILYARDVLERHPGAEILFDVKCSRTLPAEIRKAGGKATMWKTGHSLIKAKLKETGAQLAGEMSGHTFFKERWFGFDDGLYTGARLLEVLARDPRSTHEVFDSLPNTVNTPELHLTMAEGEHYALIEELTAKASFPDAQLTTIDGVRADFIDGFGLVRASNTTPVLVFRFEGDDKPALEKIQERFRRLLYSVRPNVRLPF